MAYQVINYTSKRQSTSSSFPIKLNKNDYRSREVRILAIRTIPTSLEATVDIQELQEATPHQADMLHRQEHMHLKTLQFHRTCRNGLIWLTATALGRLLRPN